MRLCLTADVGPGDGCDLIALPIRSVTNPASTLAEETNAQTLMNGGPFLRILPVYLGLHLAGC